MLSTRPISLNFEEVRELKSHYLSGAAYSDRVSLALVLRLMQLRQELGEDHIVIREIDGLEAIHASSVTKDAEQFKRPPLYPLWHKHFSAPRHLFRNIGIRWSLEREGNRDLTKLIEEAAAKFGHEPELWPKYLVHKLVLGGLQERVDQRRMTGDWIIFGKHDGRNFYLDLATHQEGLEPDQLIQKLRHGSEAEFPFLFA